MWFFVDSVICKEEDGVFGISIEKNDREVFWVKGGDL